jgi:hypothetical protein
MEAPEGSVTVPLTWACAEAWALAGVGEIKRRAAASNDATANTERTLRGFENRMVFVLSFFKARPPGRRASYIIAIH